MIRLAPYIALMLIAGAAVWWVMELRAENATLNVTLRARDETIAEHARTILSKDIQIGQQRFAMAALDRQVQAASIARAEFDTLEQQIRSLNDATPLPPAIGAALDGLRCRRDPDCDRGRSNSP